MTGSDNPYASPRAFHDAEPVGVDLKKVKWRLLFPGLIMTLSGIGMTIVAVNAIHQNWVKLRLAPELSPYEVSKARFVSGCFAVSLLTSLFFVYCGGQMIRRRRYKLCVTASLLMMIPLLTPFIVLGIPIGVWALVILFRKDTRAAFAQAK